MTRINPPFRPIPLQYDEQWEDVQSIGEFHLYNTLIQLWTQANNGRYTVYTGAINWAKWDYEKYPNSVSIMIIEQGFLKDMNNVRVSFELFARMPEREPKGREALGVDIVLASMMKRDVRGVCSALRQATRPNTRDRVCDLIINSDSMTDNSDSILKIQGVVANFLVSL